MVGVQGGFGQECLLPCNVSFERRISGSIFGAFFKYELLGQSMSRSRLEATERSLTKKCVSHG